MPPAETLNLVLPDYALPKNGLHGIRHWGRVWENGVRLADELDVNPLTPGYFAVFHDCRRVNEGWDPDHGLRGAKLAAQLQQHIDLSDSEFEQLHYACEFHTDGMTEAELAVQICWDADRLDLGRVGMLPDPRLLCTEPGKRRETIAWAHGRASLDARPEIIPANLL